MRELRAGKANKNRDVAELDPHWVLGVKPDLTLQLCEFKAQAQAEPAPAGCAALPKLPTVSGLQFFGVI